jgi:amino acid adenylation domain-containing protein/non-ribosomal peptide synthase protein (TIGR01720 family)
MSEQPSGPNDLSPERRSLLALRALRLKGQARGAAPAHTIPRLPRREGVVNVFPLSPAQERLWFLDQLMPGSVAYNLTISMRVEGPLDAPALEASLNDLALRHEVLRTKLQSEGGRPSQFIAPGPDVRLKVLDLSSLPDEEREAEAGRVAADEVSRPFDLAEDDLMRAVLLRLGAREQVVLVIFHHVVFDMWSGGLFIRELATVYEARVKGRAAELPPLPLQYADFSVWQRQWLEGGGYRAQLDYWKRKLGGELPVLELPTDRPRPPVQTSSGAQQMWQAPKSLADALNALCEGEGTTLFMTLLAAFKALVYRYTGQANVIVGSPIASRNRSELEGLVGFFINVLIFRTDLAGASSFRDALARVRQTVLDAYANQDVPFNKLIQELQPERDLSLRQPLFQISFSLQNAPAPSMRLRESELLLTQYNVPAPVETFEDINFFVTETEDGLAGTVEYNTDLFDAETIGRMIGHYRRLLEAVVADPDQPLSAIDILTEGERRQLLVGWNETAADYPRTACLHELFEEQARATPDATVVVFGSQRLTYGELDARANRLARHVSKLGAGPESVVGICVERSPEVVVAILGVLKAGCAYLMLDPTYPPERLSLMLEDSGVAVLLTQESLRGREFARAARAVVCLDSDREAISHERGEEFDGGATADNLAFVVYTSGSTGRPKGSGLPHRALTNLISWHMAAVSRGARAVQFASLSFDMSLYEIFSTCCSGGTLFIIPESLRTDLAALARYVADERVEELSLPVVALQQLAEEFCEQPELFSSLRRVIVAGEQPTITRHVARLFEQLEGCVLHNHYGPSETHVATSFAAKGSPRDWPRLPPVGRPISNTEIYVLDARMRPVPIGVAGEVYIGGDCLARGYLNRPGLTAGKFVPNPFGPPGARLYRTGDLARYLPDGDLKFLGRADHQVKVRGYRIELGEVEAVLGRCPCVRDVVVVAREDEPGQKRLVAYVLADATQPGAVPADLRRHTQERLPDYMVPSAFVLLDAFPQLPNGKVDRRSLPAPAAERSALGDGYVPPRTPAEKTLADIWARALGLDRVGVNDNFIELGGDSILSFQVVARANRAGLRLSLKQFYHCPTVAELARLAEAEAPAQGERHAAAAAHAAPDIPQLERLRARPNVEDAYSLTPLQQGMLFHDLSDPVAREYVEVVSFAAPERLEPELFERAWQTVAGWHPALRTAFAWEEFDEPVQVVYRGAAPKVEQHDLSGLPPREQQERFEAFVRDEQRRDFDLAAPPLMHLSLLKLDTDAYQFVWSYKHLILDGWSRGLVLGDVGEVYRALAAGDEPRPREVTAYRRYIEWLRAQDLAEAEAFWRRAIGEAPPPPAFAPDASLHADGGGGQAEPYGEQRLELSAETTAALVELGRRHGLTLNTLVQGAWALLLSRYSGEPRVAFGTTASGRAVGLASVEEVVGLLINTLPTVVEVADDEPIVEWLGRLQRDAAEALQYESTALSEVQRWAGVGRGTQLFDSILVFGNLPARGEGPWTFADRSLQRTGYPIQILFEPGASLSLRLTYSTRRFDEAGARRLLEHYRAVVEGLAARPRGLVGDLSLLGAGERRRLLLEFNDTRAPFALDRCFHQHFEAQAAATPDAPAVIFGDEEVTYAELNARANGAARVLAGCGVGPDVLVALLAERGVEFLTAVLGIFKAGGAYLPLDPRHPAPRIAEVLGQSRVPLVLSVPEFAQTIGSAVEQLAPAARPQVMPLEEAFAHGPVAENPRARGGPGNLAYVIYTSGSTGRPKGAMVEQAGMLNHLRAKIADLRLTADDEVAQTASQCFDISVWQFLAPLLVGGRTHVIGDDLVHDPTRLLERIRRSRISVVETVPSLLRMVVEEVERTGADSSPLGGLRWMIPTGEALPPELCRRWFASHPHVPLLNAYGPTECADDVSHCLIRRPPPAGTANMPIGRPVSNMRLYVLRGHMQPLPVGVAGELYVGGVGVGRGYLHDPGRTAEVFVPDPFAAEPGARLYKTGDQARHLPGGELEFLGRLDSQVKIRGYRIELGDIEYALGTHPSVGEAVVVAREDQPGDKRLAAYVTAHAGSAPRPDELREYLRGRLPEYMLPAGFVLLEAMPLTPNGKIDRRRLPAVRYDAQEHADGFTPPRDAKERALADIWAEVLGVERVGTGDNFFRLGGDSILSIQVVSKARRAGLLLSAAQLFTHQTLAELAAVATAADAVADANARTPVTAPLTPIQQWFFEQDYPDPHYWNQSVVLRARQALDRALLERAVGALVAHHDALRLRFFRGQSGLQQRAGEEPRAPFTFFDLSATASEDEQLSARLAAMSRMQTGLDLARGPLLRVALFGLGEGRQDRLLVTVHHLAVDGVSWRILLEDLQTAYAQLARGEAVELPPPTTPYTRWAARLAEHARSEEVRGEFAYWAGVVEAPHAPLPRDFEGGANTVASTRVLSAELDEEETRSILRGASGGGEAGVNDLLLSALLSAVGRWTGANSLFVDLEGHGREEVGGTDVSRTVGWFTTLFPVSLSAPCLDAGELLRSVRERLSALPNKGLGYGLLRYLSGDEEVAARLRAAPRPEISFNYLGQFDRTLSDSAPFETARESAGPARNQEAVRGSLLDVTALVTGGRLRVDWHYSENLHRGATVEALARDFVDALRKLITRRPAPDVQTPSDVPHVPRELIEDTYRLSPLQQGILFDLRYAPGSGAYALQLALTLKGRLDADALKQALQQVVSRHTILRTSFHWEGLDEPVQVVRRQAPLGVVEEDWRLLPEAARAARLDEYLREDRRRGFDLSEPPLMRAALLRTGDETHEFVWSWHHLILDGWSFSLLMKEIITIYNGLCDRRDVSLPGARPYADYIRWLERQDLSQAESYWRGVLRGASRPTVLAAEGGTQNPPGSPSHGAQSLALSPGTTAALVELTRGHGLTLNTLAQGAWALLLRRYSGERRVTFGTTASGRGIVLPGVESMVGLFINTLPVCVDVDEGEPAVEWLARLQAEAAEARRYEFTPLSEVRRAAGVGAGTPLFESILVFKNIVTGSPVERQGGGLEVVNPRVEHKTGYPLHVTAEPGPRFVFNVVYETAKFGGRMIGLLLQNLERLIEGLVADPRRPLAELSLVTDDAHQQAFDDLADLEDE